VEVTVFCRIGALEVVGKRVDQALNKWDLVGEDVVGLHHIQRSLLKAFC